MADTKKAKAVTDGYRIEWDSPDNGQVLGAKFRLISPNGEASPWAGKQQFAVLSDMAAISTYLTGCGDKIGTVEWLTKRYLTARAEDKVPRDVKVQELTNNALNMAEAACVLSIKDGVQSLRAHVQAYYKAMTTAQLSDAYDDMMQ